jgi:hypothetical protein
MILIKTYMRSVHTEKISINDSLHALQEFSFKQSNRKFQIKKKRAK